MSRQIGTFNHEELIVALVAITAQLFLIPQKSPLAKVPNPTLTVSVYLLMIGR